jgi:predicted amidohydrolase YtcJ
MHNNRRGLAITLACLLIALTLTSCSPSTNPPNTEPSSASESIPSPTSAPQIDASSPDAPSLIYFGGEIITMDENRTTSQAIAIRGDKIIAVGDNESILALQTADTTLVDLQGRTIMPGFVDAHSHLFNDAANWGLDFEGAQQLALEYGITSLANMFTTPDFLNAMTSFSESDSLRIRTSLYLNYNDSCGQLAGDWYKDHPATRLPGEMLRIGGVKIFTDGGACGAPAVSFDHPAYGFGSLWFTQDELNAAIIDIQDSGHQVAVHALGDRAVEQALNALEFALNGAGNSARHRIEHNALVRDDQLSRYGEIGVVPLIFGSYPICNSPFPPPPAAQDGWEWRWRDLINANPDLRFAWHSDMNVPIFGQISPIQHLFSMLTPLEVSNDGVTVCETAPWLADKTLTAEEALPMMTINSAYALFRDEEVGSLEVGKFADLIVLSGNPLSIDPEKIIDLQVLTTMLSGRIEHCADNNDALCPAIESLSLTQPARAWEFDTEQDLVGWGSGNQHDPFSVDQGNMRLNSTGPDSWIYLPPNLSIPAESTPQLEIRMKVSAGFTGQLFFQAKNETEYTEENSLRFDLFADDLFHVYTLDMSTAPGWQGLIDHIRFDPTDLIASIEIDYIRIISQP